MTSDITKMYRQIYVDRSQTCLQRILWREESQDVMKIYELKTVTYGTAAAPFLATRSVKQLAIDESSNFPLASNALIFDTYVDDIVTGAETLSDALELQSQLLQLTKRGCFQLHKWCANDDRLLEKIPEKDRETIKRNVTGEYIKALGMFWQPKEDFIVFKPPEFDYKSKVTKRNILSDVAKMFDPLGLLAPIIVTAKLLMQDLWKNNADWDDDVSDEIEKNWCAFRNDLTSIANIQLPRCVYKKDSVVKRTELHGFADASEKAYGACLYIKTIDVDDNVTVNLVCSKSRVAPLKTITLPHLELCAALLLSKVVTAAIEALTIDFEDVVLWSDSTITLFWISTPPYKLKTFVANRVNEIQQHTINFTWKHVTSKNNPADIVSRGIMPNQLKDLVIWWKGPSILHSTVIVSEIPDLKLVESIMDLELKQTKSIFNVTASNNSNDDDHLTIFTRFSSYNKLIRITAYCLRFIKRCRKLLINNQELTVQELSEALNCLVKSIQAISFEKEIKLLNTGKGLPPNSKIKSLNPFLDTNNILRVGGRLKNVNMDNDAKHQILLPSHHKFVELIFDSEHRKRCHAGPQLLLSLVRAKFWPIAGKGLAKLIVRNCVVCARSKPTITKQIMGNLPQERVSQTKPFLNSGVDYCGPFFIRNKFQRKSAPYKVYVASFVCFSTKSMHLEMVSDLTSQSFIACLKRFLSRRGKVANIWSDNATNFVGADQEIKQLFQKFLSQSEQTAIISFCTSEQINWNFIPPRAPNFGGLWEASIKSFKFHLNRVTKGTVLTLEEFLTLIIQIEGILNSRPLTSLSDDPHDPQPLTPNHFLTGGPNVSLCEPSLSEIPDNYLTKWQQITKMIESFWKRYSTEYLHTLQIRTKWKQEMPNIKVNDIVMLVDDNIPSIRWSLGRIVSAIVGKDGKVRVVEIQTRGRTFKRSILKVVKLPIS